MPESKIKAIRDNPRPIRKKQLRSFLGGIGYYRRYINGFASDLAELTPATAKGAPDRIMWSDAMESSFESLWRISLHREDREVWEEPHLPHE